MTADRDTLSADRGNRFGIGIFRLLLRCGGYRVAAFGFPLETLCDPAAMQDLLKQSLEFFKTE